MILLGQGWVTVPEGRRVAALVLLPKDGGRLGWEVHRGIYDPALGQTVNQATWRFLGATWNVLDAIKWLALTEMLSWEATPVQGIEALLQRIQQLLEGLPYGR